MSLQKRFPIELHAMKNLLAATCVAALLAAPVRAHDDARLHLHVNGAPVYAADVSAAPIGAVAWLARVPAPVWGVASLAVAATLVRRKRATPAAARARA